MAAEPIFCFPGDSLQLAAELIRKEGGGPVPVLRDGSSKRFLGVIQEGEWMRRAAAGKAADQRVRDIMIMPDIICRRGDDLQSMVPRMERQGIRRVPVLHADGSLAGMFTHPRHRKGPSSGGLLLSAAAFAVGALLMLLMEPSRPGVVPPQAPLPPRTPRPIRRQAKARRGELSLTATALGGGLAMYAVRGRGKLARATAMLGMGMLARGLTQVKGENLDS